MEDFKFERTPITELKEFSYFGNQIRFREYHSETDTYVYERFSGDKLICYEVVRPEYRKVDGVKTGFYPSTSKWGQKGLTVDNNKYSELIISELVSLVDWKPETRWEMKKNILKKM